MARESRETRSSASTSSATASPVSGSRDWIYLSVIVFLSALLLSSWSLPSSSSSSSALLSPASWGLSLLSRDSASGKIFGSNEKMGISKGDKIPSKSLKEENVMEASVNLATIPGRIVIVGVPGAFTTTCSNQVPSYYESASKFASKDVQGIYVLSVNDAFVTKAWKKDLFGENVTDILHFVADDTGEWTKEAGLELDMTPVVGGKRSQRYAAIVDDGIVRQIFVEEDPGKITVSHADSVLKHL